MVIHYNTSCPCNATANSVNTNIRGLEHNDSSRTRRGNKRSSSIPDGLPHHILPYAPTPPLLQDLVQLSRMILGCKPPRAPDDHQNRLER
jgi:hypothetical protein